jgi:hypothetical protein
MTTSAAEIANTDLDTLYTQLGQLLLGSGLGMGEQDPEETNRFGRKWIDARLNDLRSQLCDKPLVKELGNNLTGDIVEVAAIIASSLNNNQLLALTVSGILVRRGIEKICTAT